MSIHKRIWSAAMAPERLHISGFKQFSFKTVFKCQNVSAERVWTLGEFQTVGAATQHALDANAMVAGGCCNSRADVERIVLHGW